MPDAGGRQVLESAKYWRVPGGEECRELNGTGSCSVPGAGGCQMLESAGC